MSGTANGNHRAAGARRWAGIAASLLAASGIVWGCSGPAAAG
ncbi:MAG: hypothetical protein ABSE58_00840 [Candidatus Limnocylindrales bacterium]